LYACDVITASAVREHLYLLGVTQEEQKLLPQVALEVKVHEGRLGGDPPDLSRVAAVIAEVAAGSKSTAHLEALSALLYIVAAFTEDESQQKQRHGWNRVFYESNWPAPLDSLEIPGPARSAIATTVDAYRVRSDRLSTLLQEADAKWMAEGQPTLAPEHEVDSFLGIAGRRYFLEAARIIRFLTTERQVAAIEEAATQFVGFELRLP
jgi:hypothetical protein